MTFLKIVKLLTWQFHVAAEPETAPRVNDRRRSKLRPQARGALLWLLLLALGSHVVYWIGMEFSWPWLRDPEFGRRLLSLQKAVTEKPDRKLFLVLGSSRVVMGVRSAVLSNETNSPLIFNAGRIGAGPLMQEVLLRRYLAAGIRPNVVCIEVWPHLFNGRETDRIEPGRLRVSDLLQLGARADGRMWGDALAATFSSWSDQRSSIQQALLPKWVATTERTKKQTQGWTWRPLDAYGWLPLNHAEFEQVPREQIIAKIRRFCEPVLRDVQIDATVAQDYRSLLGLCREQHLRVVLIQLPESSEFRGFYLPRTRERFKAFVESLCAEFDADYIDGGSAVTDAGLPDGHHLSPLGAESFTRWFAAELQSCPARE